MTTNLKDSKKKINLFNSVKKFREGFVSGCEKNNIKLEKARTRNIIIHLKNGLPVQFIHKNEQFYVDDSFNFFQMRGIEGQLPALIALYCESKDISYNDTINVHHTTHAYKISQMLMLHLDNLPIPETIILTSFSYETNREYIMKHIQFPLVLKRNGDQGKKVWKIDSLEELDEKLLLSESEKKKAIEDQIIKTAILQEYIPNTHDFRVTMFEHEVFGVIKRISKDGFYNNFSRGAGFEDSEITEEEKELSQRACDACGVDLAGVDFVRTDDGILFFEVNKSPQMNAKYSSIIVDRLDKKYLS